MPWSRIHSLAAACPDCSSEKVFLQEPKLGQIVYCALCGTKLEVAYLRPIMLDYFDDDLPFNYFDDYEKGIGVDDEVY